MLSPPTPKLKLIVTLKGLLLATGRLQVATAKAATRSGEKMRLPIRLLSGIALVVLLMSGCDASEDTRSTGCRGLDGRQSLQSSATDHAGCVLGHGNTQSTDRKW